MTPVKCSDCFYWFENNDTGEECYGNYNEGMGCSGCHEFIPNKNILIRRKEYEEVQRSVKDNKDF